MKCKINSIRLILKYINFLEFIIKEFRGNLKGILIKFLSLQDTKMKFKIFNINVFIYV